MRPDMGGARRPLSFFAECYNTKEERLLKV